jgi:hypothetical protein
VARRTGIEGAIRLCWLGMTGMGNARGKGGSVSSSCVRPVGRLWPGSPGSRPDHARPPRSCPALSANQAVSGLAQAARHLRPLIGRQFLHPWQEREAPGILFSLGPSFPFSAAQPILVVSGPRSAIRSTSKSLWQGACQLLHPKVPTGSRQPEVAKVAPAIRGRCACQPVTPTLFCLTSHASPSRNGAFQLENCTSLETINCSSNWPRGWLPSHLT